VRKEAIQELVNQVFQQQHPKKQLLLLRVISKLISQRYLDVKLVCEYMLSNLTYSGTATAGTQKPTSTYTWCKILEYVRSFVPLNDYKSCRDIFRMLLEVIKRIPHSNSSYPPHLETEFLFDKENKRRKLLTDTSSTDLVNYEHMQTALNNNRLNAIVPSSVTDDIRLESLHEVSYLSSFLN
jgi:hypothetical protein